MNISLNPLPQPNTLVEQNPALEIVRAKEADMPLIASFIRSSADWYRPFVDQKDMSEHQVGRKWEQDNYRRREFYIGYVDNKPIGTLSIQYFGQFAYLGYIYLQVEEVGKGYGHQLMNFAKAEAKNNGKSGLVLIAHPKATWAKKAYLKFGFDIILKNKDAILKWNNRVLAPYYEEGFELYQYEL